MQNPETDFSFEKSVLEVDFKKEIEIPIMFTLARPLFLRRVFKSLFGFPPPTPHPFQKGINLSFWETAHLPLP